MNYQEIREWSRRARAIPLEVVLLAAGAKQDRYDKAKWHTRQGTVSVTGAKFMNWMQAHSGGGAIDLTTHLQDLDFKAAVEWLRHHVSTSGPPQCARPSSKPRLRLPPSDDHRLAGVCRYLSPSPVTFTHAPPMDLQVFGYTLRYSTRSFHEGNGLHSLMDGAPLEDTDDQDRPHSD